jgi:hypothetical protein
LRRVTRRCCDTDTSRAKSGENAGPGRRQISYDRRPNHILHHPPFPAGCPRADDYPPPRRSRWPVLDSTRGAARIPGNPVAAPKYDQPHSLPSHLAIPRRHAAEVLHGWFRLRVTFAPLIPAVLRGVYLA